MHLCPWITVTYVIVIHIVIPQNPAQPSGNLTLFHLNRAGRRNRPWESWKSKQKDVVLELEDFCCYGMPSEDTIKRHRIDLARWWAELLALDWRADRKWQKKFLQQVAAVPVTDGGLKKKSKLTEYISSHTSKRHLAVLKTCSTVSTYWLRKSP